MIRYNEGMVTLRMPAPPSWQAKKNWIDFTGTITATQTYW